MARKCEICGKKPLYGNKISHAHNVSRRRWLPNLQKVRVVVDGRSQRLTICTRCLHANKVSKA
ncbi:50S ribosomal protein L28 [bacterium]|nr:50S ribosomal protein L28 [candidate division CSSED10-310 bacterium]